MARYIELGALLAEIERRVNNLYPKNGQGMVVTKILKDHYEDLKDFLDTLEAEEWDFEKELDRIWFDNKLGDYFNNDALDFAHIRTLCRHFFELGLNKNLTWQDIEKIATIGNDFLNSEESDNLNDEAYYTEILNRFKNRNYDQRTGI